MTLLYYKFLILLLILPAFLTKDPGPDAAAAFIAAVSLSSLCCYFQTDAAKKQALIAPALNLLFCFLAFVWKPAFFFLPLAVFDCGRQKARSFRLVWLIPLLNGLIVQKAAAWFVCAVLCVLAFSLQTLDHRYEKLLREYRQVRDDTTEAALLLQQKNKQLLQNQDTEVELATLAERNRIAREIHDNVGHLLTRSILQVSALQVVYGADKELKEQLDAVKATLADAMDNVRQSVHNLHEESIDLRQQLTRLTEDFSFCETQLRFDAGPMPRKMNYAVIAIVKEALSNVARHSNATKVQITVLEHPSMYQVRIRDNGTCPYHTGSFPSGGMGISNMEERVRAFHGNFHIDADSGFQIFFSLPKEEHAS